MILIGQYDSPFVRRVGIALTLYGMPFEHRPWSTFGNADMVRGYNPLVRVPTLVLDDGDILIESGAVLDYLDNTVGRDRALFPSAEPDRHRALKVTSLATGMADKAVSLFYELRLHTAVSDFWVARCKGQIADTLATLERDLASRTTPYWFGAAIGHADIAVTCALRFVSEAHPGFVDPSSIPKIAAHAAKLEERPRIQDDLTALHRPRMTGHVLDAVHINLMKTLEKGRAAFPPSGTTCQPSSRNALCLPDSFDP